MCGTDLKMPPGYLLLLLSRSKIPIRLQQPLQPALIRPRSPSPDATPTVPSPTEFVSPILGLLVLPPPTIPGPVPLPPAVPPGWRLAFYPAFARCAADGAG